MKRTGNALVRTGLALIACLLLAGAASADEKGVGYVQSVDPAAGTVTVNDFVMTVGEQSHLRGNRGERIRLQDLQAVEPGPLPGIVNVENADRISYDARSEQGVLVIRSLVHISRGPE